jgi:hypothetical protein
MARKLFWMQENKSFVHISLHRQLVDCHSGKILKRYVPEVEQVTAWVYLPYLILRERRGRLSKSYLWDNMCNSFNLCTCQNKRKNGNFYAQFGSVQLLNADFVWFQSDGKKWRCCSKWLDVNFWPVSWLLTHHPSYQISTSRFSDPNIWSDFLFSNILVFKQRSLSNLRMESIIF